MQILDDIKIIKKYDRSDMLALLESFPAQCRAARRIGSEFELSGSLKSIRYSNIVCTGLGGSAIGADIVRSYIVDEAEVPVLVNRNYTLPNFVGKDSIVIASSYSGNTEETLSAYNDARRKRAKIIAITSGGELRARAERDGVPVLAIPGGLPPRCALGYSSLTLLAVLSKIGVVSDRSKDIGRTIALLQYMKDKNLGHGVAFEKNIAKRIASRLYDKYPVIYSGQDHIDSVVTRWRGELAENSKSLSSGAAIPEMNHNEIVGWDNPKFILKNFMVVILRDSADHPRNSKRIDVTKRMIKSLGVDLLEVESTGNGLLERIFSLVYTGDFVSFYLAILNKRDPTPVERIAYFKSELAKA